MKAFVDRFEENKAIIIFEEEHLSSIVPRNLLPLNSREGDIVRISAKIDKSETLKSRKEIRELQRQNES